MGPRLARCSGAWLALTAATFLLSAVVAAAEGCGASGGAPRCSGDGTRVLFASEVQALRAVTEDGGVDAEGLARYLLWGSIPPPRTLHPNIRALPPGCLARVRGERFVYVRYDTQEPAVEQLFDRWTDPLERVDLAGDPAFASVLQRLRARCDELAERAGGHP